MTTISRTCAKCGVNLNAWSALDVCAKCVAAQLLGESNGGSGADHQAAEQPSSLPPSGRHEEQKGDRIGRYKLLQELGEGGCGVVYMAEQEEPVRRRVALKVIKLGMDTREVVARFEAERQALSLMDHPNIARVYDGGATGSGRPYFVMELVRGIRITDYCDEANLTTVERLDLFVQVCHAVQHAHQKGIIHRDLKPSNILVTINDGVPVPKVIDFGVAKATDQRLTDKTLFTEFHHLIGTPAYMSPEQAMMTSLDIDTRSDIYSLGVLLYELLIGRLPFDAQELLAAGVDEVRRTIREEEPPRPSSRLSTLAASDLTTVAKRRSTEAPKLVHAVSGDLDWIVMKCLEKDRTRRYETASGLAADIQRHRRDEPVTARPPGAAYRFRKMVRRNKLAFGAGAAVTAALLAGIGTSTGLLLQERATRRRAEGAESVATANAQRLSEMAKDNTQRLIRLHVDTGARQVAEGNFLAALPSFVEAFNLDRRAESEPQHQSRLASVFQQCPRPLQVWFHAGPVTGAFFSPDGKRVLSLSVDEAALRDTETGLLLASAKAGSASGEASFSPDGTRAIIGAAQPFVWDLSASPPVLRSLESETPVISPRWNPGSTRVVSRTGTHEAVLWDAAEARKIAVLGHDAPAIVLTAMFAPPDRAGAADASLPAAIMELPEIVLTADSAGTLRAWHPTTGALLTERHLEPKAPPWSLAEANFDFLLTAQNGNDPRAMTHARLWSLASARPIGEPLSHDGAIKGAAFAPGVVVTWSGDGTARVWDTETAGLRVTPFRHPGEITAAGLSRDHYRLLLATGCADGTVRVWNRGVARPIGPPMLHGSPVRSVAFGPAMHTILTGCADGTVRLWNLAAAARLSAAEGVRPGRSSIYGHTWGTLLELSDGVELRGLAPAEPRRIPLTWRGKFAAGATAVSRDGAHVLVGQEANEAIECQLFSATGEAEGPVFSVPGARERASSNPQVPLGQRRVFRAENTLEIWDPAAGRRVAAPLNLPERPHSPMLSPDGRTLLWSTEGQVFVWDVDAASERRPPITAAEAAGLPVTASGLDSGPILPVGFSGFGDRFLTISDHRDNGVFCARVWNTATGQAALPPLRHEAPMNSAAFSPDDRWIVTTADDRTARVWDAQTGEARMPAIVHPDDVKMAAFGHDQRRLYTICADGYARVWDAATGEPLGAPVGHPVPALYAPYVIPLLGGRSLHTTWTYNLRWEMPEAPLPLEDWQAVAEVVSGQRRESTGSRPLTRAELRQQWTSVRTRLPDAFTTSLAQREDWNRWMTQWCFGANRNGDALEYLNELVALQPDLFLHRWNRAYASKSANDWDAVAEDLKVAAKLAPHENAVWPDLALAELVRGNMPAYRAACAEMANRLSPTDRHAHVGSWCAVAADAPNPPEVCQKLLDLLKSIGPPAAAKATAGREFEYSAASGMLCYRLGRDDEAMRHLETAQGLKSDDRTVLLFMAMLHHRRGDPAGARTLCEIVRERVANDERIYLTGRSFDSHADLAVTRQLLKEAEAMAP